MLPHALREEVNMNVKSFVMIASGLIVMTGAAQAYDIRISPTSEFGCTANGPIGSQTVVKYTTPTYNSTFTDYRAACQVKVNKPTAKTSVNGSCEMYVRSTCYVLGSGNATQNTNGSVNFACQISITDYDNQVNHNSLGTCPSP